MTKVTWELPAFGARLHKTRIEKKVSVAMMSMTIGITDEKLEDIEAGKVSPTLTQIAIAADLLRVDGIWLAHGVREYKLSLEDMERITP